MPPLDAAGTGADQPDGQNPDGQNPDGHTPDGQILAAVDIGTNSFHLVVARVRARRFEVMASEREMVRLGSGSGDMKLLRPEAIDRGVATLRRFRQVADINGARLRAVATSAVREAENQAEFLERARREAGVEVEVIPGVEEARLIHLGVLQALPVYDQRLLVVDIGGGSTEFLVGEGAGVLWARSLKLGAIRLTDRFFPGGLTNDRRVDRCRRYLDSFLAPHAREVRDLAVQVSVGSSGTIENLATMAAAFRGDPPLRTVNSARIGRTELEEITRVLLEATTPEERARIPGVEPRRADIVAAGALLLERIFDAFDVDAMTVSGYALREGVLLDTLHQRVGVTGADGLHHLSDLRRASVDHVLDTFDGDDAEHARQAAILALQLFEQSSVVHGLSEHYEEYLEAGALLANVGRFVAHSAHHKHSYYLIRNTDQLTGFTSHEIELIAQIARYHRKSAPKQRGHTEFSLLPAEDQRAVRILAGLLRIAIGLDRGHAQIVQRVCCDFDAEANELTVEAIVADTAAAALEAYTADARKELAEAALGCRVRIVLATP